VCNAKCFAESRLSFSRECARGISLDPTLKFAQSFGSPRRWILNFLGDSVDGSALAAAVGH
jgi:hypothetical protein